jgi:hypothetical protein
MATQLSITDASWGQIAGAAALSVSATANVAVTKWKNTEGYYVLKPVKFIVTETLYAGIFVLGTLEAVARAVCAIVLIPLSALASCLNSCLPECVTWMLDYFAGRAVSGAQTSLATAFEALFILVRSTCCDINGPIYLEGTYFQTPSGSSLEAMTKDIKKK